MPWAIGDKMKRTLYIESIKTKKEGQPGLWYAPIHQNAEYIFNLIVKSNVSCEKVDQISDQYWRIEIKGKKKNVRTFITSLTVAVAGVYNVRVYV
jgi:hypothetical protein